MNINIKRILLILLILALLAMLAVMLLVERAPEPAEATATRESVTETLPPSPTSGPSEEPTSDATPVPTAGITEDGTYDSKEDVAEYLHTYGHLPSNYITKDEARKLGWDGGSVEDYAPGMCIGGDRFGNYEKKLPTAKGRTYYECDIDTIGWKNRGSRRIIYSNDGLIFYTGDHYGHFEQLY